MLNVTVLAGKIASFPKRDSNLRYDNTSARMMISVQRNYQNSEGDYDSDLFEVILWRGISDEISDHFKIGDQILIRGRLEIIEDHIAVIAEQISVIREVETKPEA